MLDKIAGLAPTFLAPSVRNLLPLGFACGLPFLLTSSTLAARLTHDGVSLTAIGLYSLVGLPYSLKPLWAPLLDHYQPPWLGHRRGWLALLQLALAAAIAGLALADPRHSLQSVVLWALLVAFLSASQDIVGNAYSVDILTPEARPAGASLFMSGYRIAMLTAGGLALVLADHFSWRSVYLTMAAIMLLGMAFTLAAPEPEHAAVPRSLRGALIEPLREYLGRRGALLALAFLSLYRLGDALAANMMIPFLLSHGYSQGEVGLAYKICGTVATIAGALVGGVLVANFGLFRSLFVFGFLQAAANIFYILLAQVQGIPVLLYLSVVFDSICSGLAMGALNTLLIGLCDRRFSATQFALLTAVSGVIGRLLGSGAGWLVEQVGWTTFFTLTILLAAPGLAILPRLRTMV